MLIKLRKRCVLFYEIHLFSVASIIPAPQGEFRAAHHKITQ